MWLPFFISLNIWMWILKIKHKCTVHHGQGCSYSNNFKTTHISWPILIHLYIKLYNLYLSQCLWFNSKKSSNFAISLRYWVSFKSSLSLSLFKCAFMKGFICWPKNKMGVNYIKSILTWWMVCLQPDLLDQL